MKLKISKTWLVIIAIIVIIIGYYAIKAAFKNPAEGLITEKVQIGEVLQEVSETGSVKATQDLSLGFKTSGRVSNVLVSVGDSVQRGQALASLDQSQILAQLQSAQAALASANSEYDKLINGLTTADLKTYEDAVTSAQQDLDNTYAGATSALNDAYNKANIARDTAADVRDTYFTLADQAGVAVSNAILDIESNLKNSGVLNGNSDSAIAQMAGALKNILNDLQIIRQRCDEGIYSFSVSSTAKTSLDTQKTNISTSLTSITTLQNSVASDKVDLQKAQNTLASKAASARPEDISIYKAKVEQAQADVDVYQSQLNDNNLRSPINATITEISVKPGQVIAAAQTAVKLLSSEPFEIKVAIYEQDIVNVKTGNDVKINLVAFPRQDFYGKVLAIDPAETIIDNVVYYEVTVSFSDQPVEIKSGMTADIVIQTDKKENVLRVTKNAVVQIGGRETVQVLNGSKTEDRIITTGLEGNDYLEVTSGLSEGETIVTGKQQ